MIDLFNFFKNHFDTDRISDDNLNKFGMDHCQRLLANNPGGKYNGLITETTSASDAFAQAIQNESRAQALQEAGTVETDTFIHEFIELLKVKEGIIRGTWSKESAEYQEFFPRSIEEYHRATKANIADLMNRFILAAEDHAEELPDNFATLFTTVRTNFMDARRLQLNRFGTTDGLKQETALKRKALSIRLMKNLLTIAAENIGNINAVSVYFEQSIIRPRLSAEGNEIVEGSPEPGKKFIMMDGDFGPQTLFAIENTGMVPLKFYTTLNPETEVPATAFELTAGGKAEMTASQLGDPANTYMICYNPSTDTSGGFIAEVKEKVK